MKIFHRLHYTFLNDFHRINIFTTDKTVWIWIFRDRTCDVLTDWSQTGLVPKTFRQWWIQQMILKIKITGGKETQVICFIWISVLMSCSVSWRFWSFMSCSSIDHKKHRSAKNKTESKNSDSVIIRTGSSGEDFNTITTTTVTFTRTFVRWHITVIRISGKQIQSNVFCWLSLFYIIHVFRVLISVSECDDMKYKQFMRLRRPEEIRPAPPLIRCPPPGALPFAWSHCK